MNRISHVWIMFCASSDYLLQFKNVSRGFRGQVFFQMPLSRKQLRNPYKKSGFFKRNARDKHTTIIWAFSIQNNCIVELSGRHFLFLCTKAICVVVNPGGLEQMFPASVNIGQEKIGSEVWPCCNNVGRDVVPWHHLGFSSGRYELRQFHHTYFFYDFADILWSTLLAKNQLLLFHVWVLYVIISSLTGKSPVAYQFSFLHRHLSLNHNSYRDVAL